MQASTPLIHRALLVMTFTLLGSCLWIGCKPPPPPAPPPVAPLPPLAPVPPIAPLPPLAPPITPDPPAVPPTLDPIPLKPAPENPPAETPQTTATPKLPLFEGWPEPQLVLFVTGQQQGYIEPCGCTGLANQKGGLARRQTLLTDLRDKKKWNVVPIDVGSQSKRFGRQSEIKFQRTADALRSMGYQAVALGADDLRLTADELFSGTNADPDKESIFVSANVAIIGRELQPTFKVIEAGGKKIGITSVLGDTYEQKLPGDLIHEPALGALEKVSAELKEQKCDLYVLLCHATLDESRKIAAAAPLFDLIITAGGVGEPTLELEEIPGTKAKMAQVGTKGMYTGVIGLYAGEGKDRFRYQRVPLDDRWQDSPGMLQLLATYQEELKTLGFAELGLKPQAHPSGLKFVGSEKCGECHTKAYEIWAKTPHAHATESLVKPPNSRGDIARHYDPECLSCHVTGWEPQKFFPYATGYLSLEQTPLLKNNGCENCHGPGSAHVAAESGAEQLMDAEIMKRREAMKLPLAGGVAEKKCMECHDLDNSPDFHVKGAFEKYWKEVEHKGKD